jgi:hypothetical protein
VENIPLVSLGERLVMEQQVTGRTILAEDPELGTGLELTIGTSVLIVESLFKSVGAD